MAGSAGYSHPSPAAVVAIAVGAEEETAQDVLAAFLVAAGGTLRDCAAGGDRESGCVVPTRPVWQAAE